jgi:uncharacterized membrane protein
MNARKDQRRLDWAIPAGLIALSAVPVLAGTARLAQLARGAVITAANARFFAMPLPVVLHIAAAIPFSILGALQFAPAFRRRHPAWHRATGRVLVVCGLVVAVTGLIMTLVYPWPKGDGEAVYFERLIAGSAMLGSMLLAIDAIRRRNFGVHGEWMIRAYALAMGAGTQVLTHLPYFLLIGTPDESARGVLMGAGWVINVVVGEWVIRRMAAGKAPRASFARRMTVAPTT